MDKPILFSAPMVLAIQAGTKTAARWLLEHQYAGTVDLEVGPYHPTKIDRHGNEYPGPEVFGAYSTDGEWGCKCPYGAVGDRLWVPETWSTDECWNDRPPSRLPKDAPILYHADMDLRHPQSGNRRGAERSGRTRASIHLPRWASRIALEICSVRVERLGDITEAGAIADGVEPNWTGDAAGWSAEEHGYIDYGLGEDGYYEHLNARGSYRSLWDSLYGVGAWLLDRQKWVWVVEFRKVSS